MTRPASDVPRGATPGRARWWVVLIFIVSLPAVTTRLYSSDEIEYFAYLRSIWFDHDLSFDNEYRYFYDRDIARGQGFHETFLELRSATGLRLNFATIGSALLWSPFYAMADAGVRIARVFGSPVPADGFSRPYLAAVTYGSAIYGFLALLISAHVARRIVGEVHAATLIVGLGTPLVFYMYVAPGMSHACSAFAVASFVAVWLIVRDQWSLRGLAALGLLAGLMTMVREQDAFFAIGPAIDFAWTGMRNRNSDRTSVGERIAGAAIGVAAAAIAAAPQAWAYIVLNGRLGPDASVANKMQWTAPHAVEVLFSPAHGFFFWTPLALLSLAGLVAISLSERPLSPSGIKDPRHVGICLLAMFALQVYVAGSVDSWSVAGAFGQRRFVATTVLLVVGLAALLQAFPARRMALAVAMFIAVWWNLGLAFQFGAGLMDRQRLDLATNAYNTFIVVPLKAPSLTYRYLFDRSSFYRPAAP